MCSLRCLKLFALFLPALLMLLGFGLKMSFAKFVRFKVVADVAPALSPEELRTAVSALNVLCVGCTAGIGEGIARAVCTSGGKVRVVGRRAPDGLISACPSGSISHVQADLSSMQKAQEVAKSQSGAGFDTVVFTVGIVNGPTLKRSSEGIEMDTAVSFLSRFVMAPELIQAGALASSAQRKPRIFVMGFSGVPDAPQIEDFNWDSVPWKAWPAHKNSVVGNDALVHGLSRRHPEVNVYGLNPGIMVTDIMVDFLGGPGSIMNTIQRFVIGRICPAVEDYAFGSAIQLLVAPSLENKSGTYYNQAGEQIHGAEWLAEAGNADKLWDVSATLASRALAFGK